MHASTGIPFYITYHTLKKSFLIFARFLNLGPWMMLGQLGSGSKLCGTSLGQKIGVQVGNHLDHPSHEKHYFHPSIVEAKVWPVTRVIA